MPITVVCPQCRSRYQLDSALRGQKIRCPNANCKATFDVVEAPAPAPVPTAPAPAPTPVPRPPAPTGSQSGSVSNMVPMLPAEVVQPTPKGNHVSDFVQIERAEPAPSNGPSFGDWRSGPPPKGGAAAPSPSPPPPKPAPPPQQRPQPKKASPPPVEAKKAPPVEPEKRDKKASAKKTDEAPSSGPIEMPPGSWETPPPRSDEKTETAPPVEVDEEEAMRRAKKQKARRLMIAMIVGTLLVFGIGWIVAIELIGGSADAMYADAMKQYEDKAYSTAARTFRKLVEKHPDSIWVSKARFFGVLAEMRADKDNGRITEMLDRIEEFIANSAKDPEAQELLEEQKRDVGMTLVDAIETFLKDDEKDDNSEKILDRIDATIARIARQSPGMILPAEVERVTTGTQAETAKIRLAEKRKKALDKLNEIAREGGASAIKSARLFVKESTRIIPNFENDPEALRVLTDLYEAHRKTIVYKAAKDDDKVAIDRQPEDTEPAILLDPLIGGARRQRGEGNAVVLTVARGVLYALDPTNGEIRWAMRVGIDTAQLPIRLPPTAAHPIERLLVLSHDARTLTTLNLDGQRLWEYRLGSPCLGKPLIVKGHAYLPTIKGEVHEVLLSNGKLQGRWQLGQTLSVGGVHQKGTNLVYFPAEDTSVYILDVAKHECEMVLYTNHLAGTLRGEPLILNNEGSLGENVVQYLLLTQSEGIDETVLKLYELPIKDRHDAAVAMKPEPRLKGWTWFTPYADSEKIVCLSDAARLGLFGIRQALNKDNPLFPFIPGNGSSESGLDLTGPLQMEAGARRNRSLVAHVQGDDFWVLANGKLQRLEVRLTRGQGPDIVSRWKQPLELGPPLHDRQIRETREGSTLYLATQPGGRSTILVTALDPEAPEGAGASDPRIQWQRQLGMVSHGEPMTLSGEVLAMDRSGGLFRFDLEKFKGKDGWLVGDESVGVARGMVSVEGEPPQMIQADPKTVYAIAAPGGTKLMVRRYQSGSMSVSEHEIDLEGAKLSGNIALVGSSLVVPLDNGNLVRYAMPFQGRIKAERGEPTWRSRSAGTQARCHITALSDEEFLTTDGDRGLTRWRWKLGQNFAAVLPPGKFDGPSLELTDRLATPPLVLLNANAKLQVLAADTRGVVSLLSGDGLGAIRTWDMGGRITAGPFLRDKHIGLIVDNTRLVWLDAAKDGKLWEHKTGGEHLVGEPRLIEDLVVICDEDGRYVGLDPATGKPAGEGYHLKSAVAPAATPVAFGKGRAFAPLTDGTIMLLSLDRLKAAKGK